jgi:flavin-dependent thymidylate synthase
MMGFFEDDMDEFTRGEAAKKRKSNMAKVTIVDYTGYGNEDPYYAAKLLCYAKATRIEQSEETREEFKRLSYADMIFHLSQVAKSIRSSWEFVSLTFQIEGCSRAFTQQAQRTRYGVSFAEQAQRVVNKSSFDFVWPTNVDHGGEAALCLQQAIEQIRKSYTDAIELGVDPQDARSILPMNVNTALLWRLDLRALADMLGKRKSLRAQGEYAMIAAEMERLTLEIWPWAEEFIRPERTSTPALDAILKRLLGNASPVSKPEINEALKELDKVKGIW